MDVKDLIRAGKTDLLQELYDSVLNLVDIIENGTSAWRRIETRDKVSKLSNECVSEARLARLKQTGFALLYRKPSGKSLPMLKLLEGGKDNGRTPRVCPKGKEKS